MPTEPSLTSAVRRSERLGTILRRQSIPSLEHVTWRDPTVTPSRLAMSSRLIPSATNSLIFSIACGVNLTRLPLTDEMAFVIVMAAPFGSRPVVVVYIDNPFSIPVVCELLEGDSCPARFELYEWKKFSQQPMPVC